MVDTAGLALELSSPPGAASEGSATHPRSRRVLPRLSDLARSLGLPVHRPHHADGDALTTAQAFIALATHLEAFESPPTVGSLEELSAGGGATSEPGAIRRLLQRLQR